MANEWRQKDLRVDGGKPGTETRPIATSAAVRAQRGGNGLDSRVSEQKKTGNCEGKESGSLFLWGAAPGGGRGKKKWGCRGEKHERERAIGNAGGHEEYRIMMKRWNQFQKAWGAIKTPRTGIFRNQCRR